MGLLIFRKDRYNLAKIKYVPFLRHSSNPETDIVEKIPRFVPTFVTPSTNLIGGEVDGQEELQPGEYIVERDINIRPSGKLILPSGVTLRFPPGVGMMVAGKLDAHGKRSNDILFTLKEEQVPLPSDEIFAEEQMSQVDEAESVPVRLLGGKTSLEGRLQVL